MSSGGSNSASVTSSVPSTTSLKRKSDDVAWQWGECRKPNNMNWITCLLCQKSFSGGVSRLKEHITQIRGNVTSCPNATMERDKMQPHEWWLQYGSDTPSLTKFAIKVLSQTCSASPCERNWSAFDNMFSNSKSDTSDHAFDIDDFLQIGTMRMELRKEKDMLRESQSKSAELIRGLELDVKALSEARLEDKHNIQELERELQKCSEEMGTLQDQLNIRTIESNWLGEHVHSLELKLKEMSKLPEKINQLREERLKSNSDCLFLMRELENKEVELRNSTLYIEKLEEVIASIALDSECEIEGMKLDLINMEQMSTEAGKFQEKTTQEKAKMDGLIEEFAAEIQDSHKAIELLENENRDLRHKLETSENFSRIFARRIEEYLKGWLEKKDRSQFHIQSCNKQANELHLSKETGICEEILGPLLSKLAVVAATNENSKDEMEKMSQQIHEYELVVEKLKDELREEKLKAKEEAEDLTQEMAELRYRITGMLEDECKRRAHIEQASLQRIIELESQLTEVRKLAESRSMEIHHLKSLLKGSHANGQRNEACKSCRSRSSEEPSEAKYIIDNFMNDDRLGQLSLACVLEEPDHEDKSIVLFASNHDR